MTTLYVKLFGILLLLGALWGAHHYIYQEGWNARDDLYRKQFIAAQKDLQTKYDSAQTKVTILEQQVSAFKTENSNLRVSYANASKNIKSDCRGSVDFSLLLNAAASNRPVVLSSPSPRLTGETTTLEPINLSTVGASIADNYAKCNQYIKQLDSLITYEEGRLNVH